MIIPSSSTFYHLLLVVFAFACKGHEEENVRLKDGHLRRNPDGHVQKSEHGDLEPENWKRRKAQNLLMKQRQRKLGKSGYKNSTLSSVQPEIIGGSTVTSSKVYRFFCSIMPSDAVTELCGGSLVAPDVFLTAAHCENGAYKKGGQAIVGAYQLATVTSDAHLVDIVDTTVNPKYKQFYAGDLMLVKFTPAVTDITPVTLNFKASVPSSSSSLTIMGFGSTKSGALKYPKRLQNAQVPQVPYKTCHASFSQVTRSEFICVGKKNPLEMTCSGDSGGPLMDGNIQVGVLSYGANPCADGPSVFTRTAEYATWLKNTICKLSDYKQAGAIKC